MKINEKRKYRKYAPWIFYGIEAILFFEILYLVNNFLGAGFVLGFVFAFLMKKPTERLIRVLERQKKYKKNKVNQSIRRR